jgi:hypothetical protein
MRVLPFLAPAALIFAFQPLAFASNDDSFNPNSYPKQVATCKAVNRVANHTTPIDIQLRAPVFPHGRLQNFEADI